jgi:hypothetical protein
MIWRIPIVADTTEFTQSVELDGSTYVLRFSYSERTAVWYMSVYFQQDGTTLVTVAEGVPVLVNFPLLAGNTHANRPLGEFMVRATLDPNLDQLGSFAELLYCDVEELGG